MDTNSMVRRSRELRLFDFEDGPLVWVEINQQELPLFLFKSRNRQEQEYEARHTMATADGRRLEQFWKITAHKDFGLPGPEDRDVYVALMKLVHRMGGMPPDGWVHFSLYEILQILGKSRGANNYDNVRLSLDRIGSTSIYAENAFYNARDEDFESHRFNPWSVHFSRRKRKGRGSERHAIKFHELLVRSYNGGYLKILDADFYFSLSHAMSKTLYGLVDVRRNDNLSWTVDIHQLRQLIPLPDSYYQPSRILERLEAAHRELERRHFLSGVKIRKQGNSKVITYSISPRFVRDRDPSLASLTEHDRFVIDALSEVGVWSDKARHLVVAHGADHCLHYLDALPFQLGIENPGAWLYRYITNGYPVPLPSVENTRPGKELSAPRDLLERQLQNRLRSGEFDKTIRDFETISYEEYKTFVGTEIPVVDAAGNRFYLSLEGTLYLYLGPITPENRFFLKALDRSLTP